MAPQIGPQSITQDLPFNNGEGHISYGPVPSQWAQAMWEIKWSHGPPGFPECGSILALRVSSHPHGPWTIGHAKDPKDLNGPKKTKKAKRALKPNMIKNGNSDGQDPKQSRWSKMAKIQTFRSNLKDNGDKNPPWMMPKVNQDEEDPRGSTAWAIMGIYIHISIIHQVLSRRALSPYFWDTTQGPCIKEKIDSELKRRAYFKG
ncbi:hypothetical protein O181_012310 [Austropuccinia psidii MF-1]|uniref:Uncharacterized protein n=1 Tax=Austropuccinia psidii MF-1 TaxID=1389203 RepID=A0A9Q3BWW5_9BASI|nr:hypothetical protein [Austropuccinia psidii MF-1]